MVIDMQNDFVEPGAPLFTKMGYDLAPKMAAFLEKCRDAGMHIIYTKNTVEADGRDMLNQGKFCELIGLHKACVAGTRGVEILSVIAPKEGDTVLRKNRYSSFHGTPLDSILRTLGIETVVITGVCTEACCFSTARDAGALGYGVAFLSDLVGNGDFEDLGQGAMSAEEMKRAMLINIALTTADVMTSERLLSLTK